MHCTQDKGDAALRIRNERADKTVKGPFTQGMYSELLPTLVLLIATRGLDGGGNLLCELFPLSGLHNKLVRTS